MKFEVGETRVVKLKTEVFFIGVALSVLAGGWSPSFAQARERVVNSVSVRPSGQTDSVRPQQGPGALVAKTVSSSATSGAASFRSNYGSLVSSLLIKGIQSRWAIPYRLGSTGPERYDCSGFVWSVFSDAGFNFSRSSARTYWDEFDPVEGEERFRFGTLVFFNRLGHVGIVADEKGFYHASSSKGITYSPFAGYWEKRIVGFRRVPFSSLTEAIPQSPDK